MRDGDAAPRETRATMEAYEGFRSAVLAAAGPPAMPPWHGVFGDRRRAWVVACEPKSRGAMPDAESMRLAYEAACRMAGSEPYPLDGMTEEQRRGAWEEAACRAASYVWIEGEVSRATGGFDAGSFVAAAGALRAGFDGFHGDSSGMRRTPAATPWGMAAASAMTAAAGGATREEAALAAMRAYADASGATAPVEEDWEERWRWAVRCMFGWAENAGRPAGKRAYDDIAAERARQVDKWGSAAHPLVGRSARRGFARERDEVRRLFRHVLEAADRGDSAVGAARDFCDREHRGGDGTYSSILVEELFEFIEAAVTVGQYSREARNELVQVGAVVVAMIEAIDGEAGGGR